MSVDAYLTYWADSFILSSKGYFRGKKLLWKVLLNELQREKTYLLTCVPNEDSNQPAHARSLIKVFVVRLKTLSLFIVYNTPSEDFYQTT